MLLLWMYWLWRRLSSCSRVIGTCFKAFKSNEGKTVVETKVDGELEVGEESDSMSKTTKFGPLDDYAM